MNILLLTHSYPDPDNKWRGIFIQEQEKALSQKHNIFLVYFKVDYSHFAPLANYAFVKTSTGSVTKFEVIIKKSFPVITQLKYLSNTYRFINNEILSQNKIDIIHSHLSYPAGFLATIIQRRKKIPNILTEHSRITNYFRSWIHKKCVLYALKRSASIVTVSSSLMSEVDRYYHRDISIIHNIVDIERFSSPKSKPNNKINIGFLGGLGNSNKGLDLLLKAVSLLQMEDYFLHIGGGGSLLENYKEMAKELGVEEKCKFYGEINPIDIPLFFSTLDIFILPSRYETFGIVLIEAMACGIPVIATRCGGPEDIVNERTGILVEKDNPQILSVAIKEMSENLASYKHEDIIDYTMKKFGKSLFIEKMTELYINVLQITQKDN